MPKIMLSIHSPKCNKKCVWKKELSNFDYLAEATYSVVALDEFGHLAGAWQFEKYGKRIHSYGTWVDTKYRRNGLAKKMWAHAINYYNPIQVSVSVITDKGYTLISSLQKKFPTIKWYVKDVGQRTLRELNKEKFL